MSQSPILGVEDLLGRYRAAGEQDSSGSFTLDPKKAMERLAKFALPNPHDWVLKVIQSLHRSGASRIEVEAGINKVRVLSDRVPKGFDSMDDLLGQLLADADQSSPPLRHLAAGMQGCLAVQPRQINVRLAYEGECRNYLLVSGGWRDLPSQPMAQGAEVFELVLSRNLSEKWNSSWFLMNVDIFDLLFRRQSSLDREYKAIDKLCNFTNCTVLAGGRPANASLFGRPRFNGYEIRRDANPGEARPSSIRALTEPQLVERVAHMNHHLAEMVVPSREPGGFQLEPVSHATWTNRYHPEIEDKARQNGLDRAYAIRMEMAGNALLFFWEDGVILGSDTVPCDCPGLVALINARDLGKDLTTLQVLKDARLEKVREEVREAGQTLRGIVASNMDLMPPARTYISKMLGLSD